LYAKRPEEVPGQKVKEQAKAIAKSLFGKYGFCHYHDPINHSIV